MATYKMCGCSLVGQSHENKGIVCQDANFVAEKNGIVVAVVADGLSSSLHSDIASKIASETVGNFCLEHISASFADNDEQIPGIMHDAFDEALFQTKHYVKQHQGDLKDYDTTVSAAVFINGVVFTGQVGDSGIIALREDGFFDQVTLPQNGEGIGKDKPTYTLQHINRWKFQRYPYTVKALFLCTDGVLNKLMPPILAEQKWQFDNEYLTFLYTRLDSNAEYSCDDGKWIESELLLIPPNECNHDDKSLVIVISDEVILAKQPNEYIRYPNNELLQKLYDELDRKLYPYRYSNEPETEGVLTAVDSTHQQLVDTIPQENDNCQHSTELAKAHTRVQRNHQRSCEADLVPSMPGSDKKHNFATPVGSKMRHRSGASKTSARINPTESNQERRHLKCRKRKAGMRNTVRLLFCASIAVICIAFTFAITPVLKKVVQKDFATAVKTAEENAEREFVYDAKEHGLSIKMDGKYENAKVKYGKEPDKCTELQSPTLTNVKDSPLKVYYVVSLNGYDEVKGEVELVLKKAIPKIPIDNKYRFNPDDPTYQLPEVNTGVGVANETINGTLRWFTTEKCTETVSSLSDLIGRYDINHVTLYYQFSPSSPSDSNYDKVVGKSHFIATGAHSFDDGKRSEFLHIYQ